MSDTAHKIITLPLGPLDNLIYILQCQKTKDIAIIDPAWEANTILSEVNKLEGTLKAIYLTHGHFDHVNALDEVVGSSDIPIYFSSASKSILTPKHQNLVFLDDYQDIQLGDIKGQAIHTPGHTWCGVSYLFGSHLFAGDTLFINGCGRTNFDSSDTQSMYHSIHHKLMALPDETLIYPGHDYGPVRVDSLGNQKVDNRFMACKSEADFIKLREVTQALA